MNARAEQELHAQQEAREAAAEAVSFEDWLEAACDLSMIDKAMFMDRLFKDHDEARRVLHGIGKTALDRALKAVMQRHADDIARNSDLF